MGFGDDNDYGGDDDDDDYCDSDHDEQPCCRHALVLSLLLCIISFVPCSLPSCSSLLLSYFLLPSVPCSFLHPAIANLFAPSLLGVLYALVTNG